MKIRWIGIVLSVFFLIGITTRIFIQHEQENKTQGILNKGNYLVNLIALYPIRDLDGDEQSFLLKTLTEYISSEGLVYCFIQDHNGDSLLSLAPHDLASKIPNDIQMKSLYTMGLTEQTFRVSGSEDTIYEFAKPIFENGQRSGTVRLGLKLSPISLFSLGRIKLLAMITFFMFAMVSFIYYGITLALQPVKNLSQGLGNAYTSSAPAITNSEKNGGILHDIKDLERSIVRFKENFKKIETDNMELAAKLGVTTFEKNQISKVIDSINFGIIITDIQDNITHINAYMLNLLNKEQQELVDHPLGEILDHDEITSFIAQQGSAKLTTTGSHIETTFPELAPGEIFQVCLSYLKDNEGVIVGKMVSFKNITSEKSTEKAQHEFIAHVAHEFLTPLTTIKSYNEMLMDGEINEREMQKEFYNTINGETSRLTRLIKDLLNISKIQMGNLTLSTGLVKTDWLVEDCITAIETPAQNNNITLEKNLPDNFPSLVGDKELLKTAIINLLGNAVKYTPENGTVTFSLIEEDGMVIFDILDTGLGDYSPPRWGDYGSE